MGKNTKNPIASLFASNVKEETEEERIEKAKKNNPIIEVKPLDPKWSKERHIIIMESMTAGVEKHYYWTKGFLQGKPSFGLGFDHMIKIKDIFDASVSSSFHSTIGTKMSTIQQQLSSYLAQIGQMVKALLPIIREIRIMDERLTHYENSLKGDESAEIALKSIWIEMVEGGMQSPNSVYALANRVGFVTLPDLFFQTCPKEGTKGIDKAIKSLEKQGMNKKVTKVLANKLRQYYAWKEATYKEMQHSRQFRLKNLRQHYNVIKLYMNWLRPYLKNVKALEMKQDFSDPDIVSSFETAKMELEILAVKKKGFKKYHPCIKVHFTYVTKPDMHYDYQTGQKKPSHVGSTKIVIEPYVLTWDQIKAYEGKQTEDDIEMLASIDAAMMSLKEDLIKYLKEAGEKGLEEESKVPENKKRDASIFEPFKALPGGIKELFSPFVSFNLNLSSGVSKKLAYAQEHEKKKAIGIATGLSTVLYDIFKKANGLFSQ